MQASRNLPLLMSSLMLLGGVALAAGDGQTCSSQKSDTACSSKSGGDSYSKKKKKKAKAVVFAPLSETESSRVHALFGKVLRGELLKPVAVGSCSSAGEASCSSTKTAKRVAKKSTKKGLKKGAKKAKYANCPVTALAKELAVKPAGWSEINEELTSAFTCDEACPQLKRRLVSLMSMTRCEVAIGVAADLYANAPKSFSDDHLIALAESGSKPAWNSLMKRWEQGELSSAMPVALYAFNNKEVCQLTTDTLHKVVRAERYEGAALNQTMACALALYKHGDKQALLTAQVGVHDAVLTALDNDETDKARDLALQASYFSGVQKWSAPMKMAFLNENVKAHCKEAAAKLQSADQIFELIEKITPNK